MGHYSLIGDVFPPLIKGDFINWNKKSRPKCQPPDAERLQTERLNRRDFLKRVGVCLGPGPGHGGLGLALYDPKGPAATEARKALTGLGNYALPALAAGPGKMAIVKGTDRARMVEQGVKALGGMEVFIAKGDRVLIKVNAAFATPAALGATTNPKTLAAVAGLCLKAGRRRCW